MDYSNMAENLIEYLGGRDNITGFTNCVTRLRFNLLDVSKVNEQAIKAQEGVLGIQNKNGQYQVIVGSIVVPAAKAMKEALGDLTAQKEVKEKKGIFGTLMDTIASILTPTLPAIIGCGILKGIAFLLMGIGITPTDSDTYLILNILGDTVFYFFPVMLSVSAAKKFEVNQYLALCVGCALVYPSFISLAQEGIQDTIMFFDILPIPLVAYNGTVIPIMLSIWAMKHIYNTLIRFIKGVMQTILVPTLTLFITILLAYVVIAPLGNSLSVGVAAMVEWLIEYLPWLAGFLLGGPRLFLIMMGMHYVLTPLSIQQLSTYGYSTLDPLGLCNTVAVIGATLATYFVTKDKKEKGITISATFSALMGITEPSIFGVLIPKKFAWYGVIVGGGLGGAVSAILGARSYAMGLGTIMLLPVYFGEKFYATLIGIAVSFGVSFAYVIIFSKRSKVNKVEVEPSHQDIESLAILQEIGAPISGNIKPLHELNDDRFSKGIVGKGFVIENHNGHVVAPIDAEVVQIYPNGNAVALRTQDGVELLIHCGRDTEKVMEAIFEVSVGLGTVKQGETLITFDPKRLEALGYSNEVIMLVTNYQHYMDVDVISEGEASVFEPLITVYRK